MSVAKWRGGPMTPGQAAKYLGLSREALLQLLDGCTLLAVRVRGRRYIATSELRQYLQHRH